MITAEPRSAERDMPRMSSMRRSSGQLLGPLGRLVRSGDGYDTFDGPGLVDRVDRVESFTSTIIAIRWGMTAVSLVLSAPAFVDSDYEVSLWCVLLVAYTVLRTMNPLRYRGDVYSMVAVVAEIAIPIGAVAATGYWASPFVFSLLTAIVVAGFARGFGFALRLGVGAALAVSLAEAAGPGYTVVELRRALQWSAVLLLVAVVAGYTRRISGEADRQHSLALHRLDRLSDANALLFSLHRIAQTLPASLDLGDVLDTTVSRLRGVIEFDSMAVLVFDDTDHAWQVVRREGTALPNRLGPTELPQPLRTAMVESRLVDMPSLTPPHGPGIAPTSSSGLYTVLPARGSVIGLLAIESRKPNAFTRRDVELLNGFVEPVALAIDNARWFSRLRTVGADEERTRIARDLHDNIGQSLAYLAFELDRLVSKSKNGDEVEAPLIQLREDLRGVIGEVRDTLYDLRTDVSEGLELGEVLEQFAARIMDRTELKIQVFSDRDGPRLPLLQEREMWRIAQEAMMNVERHARARAVAVRWRCDGESGALEVADDGQGFPAGKAGRLDSYGVMGMRERASSIGATLELHSEPGRGTVVRCFLTPDTGRGRTRSASR